MYGPRPKRTRRWKSIALDEIRKIIDRLRQQGPLAGGAVNAELRKMYGTENIKHRMGHGWYRLH